MCHHFKCQHFVQQSFSRYVFSAALLLTHCHTLLHIALCMWMRMLYAATQAFLAVLPWHPMLLERKMFLTLNQSCFSIDPVFQLMLNLNWSWLSINPDSQSILTLNWCRKTTKPCNLSNPLHPWGLVSGFGNWRHRTSYRALAQALSITAACHHSHCILGDLFWDPNNFRMCQALAEYLSVTAAFHHSHCNFNS